MDTCTNIGLSCHRINSKHGVKKPPAEAPSALQQPALQPTCAVQQPDPAHSNRNAGARLVLLCLPASQAAGTVGRAVPRALHTHNIRRLTRPCCFQQRSAHRPVLARALLTSFSSAVFCPLFHSQTFVFPLTSTKHLNRTPTHGQHTERQCFEPAVSTPQLQGLFPFVGAQNSVLTLS